MNYKKVYFALFLSALIDTFGFAIVIPLIPFYALKFGASPIEVTLLFSTYALMQFLFTPLWGFNPEGPVVVSGAQAERISSFSGRL